MPEVFGGYEILQELGRGGMGTVYKARSAAGGQVVALKVLRTAVSFSTAARSRFLREGQTMARLRHRNIVAVFEMGEAGGVPFIAMEYVDSKPLSAILKEAIPNERQAITWLIQIALGVAHAHAAGIIHRDLKPGNILIDADGQAIVTDFGLATDLVADAGQAAAGEIIGTPSYMSPEQSKGMELDVRSDVFSLGGILYTLLTGQPPFAGSVPSILFQVAERDPAPPSRVNPRARKELEWVCLKAMRKEPQERYQSVGEMIADLTAFLARGRVSARPESRLRRLARLVRRNKGVLARVTCGAAGTLLLFGGICLVAQMLKSPKENAVRRIVSTPDVPAPTTTTLLPLNTTTVAQPPASLVTSPFPAPILAEPPQGVVADGDRLLGSCKFEKALASYQSSAADQVRKDLAGRLAAFRNNLDKALSLGGRVVVTLKDGTRVTVCGITAGTVRLADADGSVRDRGWRDLDREDIYHIYCAGLRQPTAEDHLNLALLSLALGLPEQARTESDEAVRLDATRRAEVGRFLELKLAVDER